MLRNIQEVQGAEVGVGCQLSFSLACTHSKLLTLEDPQQYPHALERERQELPGTLAKRNRVLLAMPPGLGLACRSPLESCVHCLVREEA